MFDIDVLHGDKGALFYIPPNPKSEKIKLCTLEHLTMQQRAHIKTHIVDTKVARLIIPQLLSLLAEPRDGFPAGIPVPALTLVSIMLIGGYNILPEDSSYHYRPHMNHGEYFAPTYDDEVPNGNTDA